jgi:broad specificity phosphatase PhoE
MKALILSLSLFLLFALLANASPMVFIVRHAEKASSGGNDPDLSEAGQKRAEALARILKDAQIQAIFTTEFKRTQETAAPTAKEFNLHPTIIPANDLAGLLAKLNGLTGNALVVGHGNTIPDLIKALKADSPINIPENDYNELFVVVLGDQQLSRLHYSF